MSNSEIGVYYGSIGEMLTFIADGQRRHDYAIVPEAIYGGWLKLQDFQKQEKKMKNCDDGVERMVYTAYFNDSGTDWVIMTVKCPHPDGFFKDGRFIVRIVKDGRDFSHSNLGIEDIFKLINSHR